MKKSFNMLAAAAGVAWLVFVFCVPPFSLNRYSFGYFNSFATGDTPFWAFVFSPFPAMLFSALATIFFIIGCFTEKANPVVPLIANGYLTVLLLLNAENLDGTYGNVFSGNLSTSIYYLIVMGALVVFFALLYIAAVLVENALEAEEEEESMLREEPQKLLNRALGKSDIPQNEDPLPRRLNPEIPKLGEGRERKQRIATKIAFTETPQKSAEDDILL